MTKNKKKTAREKRLLIGSLLIAAVIAGGSTFAWFTSRDEVTNRLSASASYNVGIAEDFTPPEDWVPGQTINKDVSAVNTGNTDAFVRMWLEGEMNILNKKASTVAATGVPSGTTATTDPNLLALGLKYYDATNKQYYRILSTKEIANPGDSTGTGVDTTADDNTYSEVKAVQAGGWLAYAPATAAFTFIPEQEYTYANKTGGGSTTVAAGATVNSSSIADSWSEGPGLAIDSDTFKPSASGLYIFRRNIVETTASGATGYEYEYSGYYYDSEKNEYYALEYKTSDYSDYVIDPSLLTLTYSNDGDTTSPVVKVADNGVKLFTAAYTEIKNDGLNWVYDSTANTLTAIYAGADGKYKVQDENGTKTDYSADDIAVVVKLDKTGTTGETWKALLGDGTNFNYYASTTASSETTAQSGQHVTFYYNNDVEPGDSTAKLVDSVTLSSDVTQNAFLAFDFDLNVKLDSIQVTKDATGNENFDTVSGGWASDNTNVTVGKANATEGAPEINAITWTK